MKSAIWLLLLLSSCSTVAVLSPTEFLVRAPDQTREAVPPRFPRIQITRVDVASHLRGITIVRAGGEVDQLVLHGWAAPIAEMVTAWTRQCLTHTGAVGWVLAPNDPLENVPELSLRVSRFEIIELADGNPVAEVRIEALLRSPGIETAEAIHCRGQVACESDSPSVHDLVQALSGALDMAASELATRVGKR